MSGITDFINRFSSPRKQPRALFTVVRSRALGSRLSFEVLEDRQLLALAPHLVTDINTADGGGSNPNQITEVSGIVFFVASTPTTGSELWKSDGTAAGTVLVKDIFPGNRQSYNHYSLTNVNGTLYFTADDGMSGSELWKSDGTSVGTVRVKDIHPGSLGLGSVGRFSSLTNVDGTVYFTADDGMSGNELWKSDGTDTGTVRVKDIRPGIGGSRFSPMTNVNGKLYFTATADDGQSGLELWRSDGTETGTVRVKDFGPENYGYGFLKSPRLTNVNGTLYFIADDGETGRELWKSDGTEFGTVRVKDIGPESDGAFPGFNPGLTSVNGTLYFIADGGSGRELWKSDGTEVGTVRVKALIREENGDFVFATLPSSYGLTDVNGTLFFRGVDSELWKSDGTEAGTVRIKDIGTEVYGTIPGYDSLTNVNGTVYFRADDGTSGLELWKSDGTEAGTTRVKDIAPGKFAAFSRSNSPPPLTNVNGTLYFSAGDGGPYGGTNRELWKSDGTEAGTVRVKDVRQGTDGSNPTSLTNVNGTLYFSASLVNGAYENGLPTNQELWKSDGTGTGTVPVRDILRGADPTSLVNVSGTLYFSADNGNRGRDLWKSDGTEAGTVRVKDTVPGTPGHLTNVNGTLYFSAGDASGRELWKSDGTAAGTVRVKDIGAGALGSFPGDLTNVNGTLYFSAGDGPNRYGNITNRELWKSDGTEAGTVRVKDIGLGVEGSNPGSLTNVNGTLYFSAGDGGPYGGTNRELWKSDGSEAGTVRVKDIAPGRYGAFTRYSRYSSPILANVNGTLFFTANDKAIGSELWTSDGTEAGTVLIKDIWPGISSSNPGSLTNVNGKLYFRANDGISGEEIWSSDGTAAGTVLAADVVIGTGGSDPGSFTEVAGKLFFAATDELHGRELWVADLGAAADDRNDDGAIDVRDLDAICAALATGSATRDEIEGFWSRQKTGPGDANFDRLFNSSDLVSVFQRGKYESNVAAVWSDGDWNCDGVFGSGDLVAAFQRGWYEAGPLNSLAAVEDSGMQPSRI